MTIAQIEALITGRADGPPKNPISTERALWTALKNEACKLYEVKEIDVNLSTNPTYLADNFDGTGLGTGDMEGFAICNGNNGTKNRKGRTSIGYDPAAYPTLGALGGASTVTLTEAQLPEITLHARGSSRDEGDDGNLIVTAPSQENDGVDLPTFGNGLPHSNMQPYIVTLMIQRIA